MTGAGEQAQQPGKGRSKRPTWGMLDEMWRDLGKLEEENAALRSQLAQAQSETEQRRQLLAVAVDQHQQAYAELEQRLVQSQRELDERAEYVTSLEDQLAGKLDQIGRMQDVLADRDADCEHYYAEQQRLEREVEDLRTDRDNTAYGAQLLQETIDMLRAQLEQARGPE